MSAWQPTSVVLMAAVLAACGGGGGDSNASPAPTPTPTPTPTPQLTTLRTDLGSPWSLAVLPDGRLLVTQRSGGLVRLSADGRQMEPIFGLPAVDAAGQGGLLDIALDPDFSQNGFLYLSFSEPGTGSESGRSGTAVFKARLQGAALVEGQVIFRQTPKVSGAGHYGSRLVFSRDKTLFVTLGKVVRIARDGSMPPDNPALGPGAAPGIYSLGHRNPQGAALHPQTGELWVSEHGPQGGDEINRIVPGGNYGWPVRSYGCNYGDPVGDACRIGGGTHAPAYLEPLTYWVPISVAPAGLLFYTGAMFPEWQGQLFSGSLAGQALWRLRLSGTTVLERTALYGNLGERFRDVRQAPDGALLLLTDSGKLLRLYR